MERRCHSEVFRKLNNVPVWETSLPEAKLKINLTMLSQIMVSKVP